MCVTFALRTATRDRAGCPTKFSVRGENILKRFIIVFGAALVALLAGVTQASATTESSNDASVSVPTRTAAEHVKFHDTIGVLTVDTTTGSLRKNEVTYYTTKRTITVSGSSIYVRKTDGPGIQVMWYKCGDRSTHGAWHRLVNSDPTPYVRIGTNFLPNTQFCLAAWDDQGSNATDTWTGNIKYNVA
jgi:hypothetical protein